MILVGGGFDWHAVKPVALVREVDADREVRLFNDGRGYLLHLKNGDWVTKVGLTPETAEQLMLILVEGLQGGWPTPTPEGGG